MAVEGACFMLQIYPLAELPAFPSITLGGPSPAVSIGYGTVTVGSSLHLCAKDSMSDLWTLVDPGAEPNCRVL